MPHNHVLHQTGLNSLFGKKAKSASSQTASAPVIEDITNLIERVPVGLKSVANFAEIKGDEKEQIGIIGFKFEHGGLTYETRFMSHDGNHDLAEFKIIVPEESPFLRPARPVLRSEKIYMLSVIHHSKEDKTWIGAHLNRLEKACFDDASGKVEPRISHPIHTNLLTPVRLFAHIGLSFSTDKNYKDEPDPVLKAFEYWDAHKRYVMDVSHYPQIDFSVSDPKISLLKSRPMDRKMAENMLREVRLAAQRETDIAIYVGTKNFTENVDSALQRLPFLETVHKGYAIP